MNIKAHLSMVFHLDKCIGCHTCSIACKNIWTDREGSEYMWWNNVETKPGTGFPVLWEDQDKFKGGWKVKNGKLYLPSQNKLKALFNLFYNPNQPGLKDYYEPFTFNYKNLFNAEESDEQPIARAISKITEKPLEVKSGPNWDDDLSGYDLYASQDKNFEGMNPVEKRQLQEIENIAMMYVPRICNHCKNPACVAACPSGAIYKRGEDGIVLVDQEKCRGWRACIAACPYKKIYYNWKTGKAEKCILCYPRIETGQATACFHSCVGRIRYMGVILYDSDKIEAAMKVSDEQLVEAQRNCLLDPFDETVIREAKKNGIGEKLIEKAQQSPVYKFVMKWKIALPLHIEYRTSPMLFYVPSLLPVMGKIENNLYGQITDSFFSSIEKSRLPLEFLSKLFSGGNVEIIKEVLMKLMAVRYLRRMTEVGDVDENLVKEMVQKVKSSKEELEEIYYMTTMTDQEERFVLPPSQREELIEESSSVETCKGCTGFGKISKQGRGF